MNKKRLILFTIFLVLLLGSVFSAHAAFLDAFKGQDGAGLGTMITSMGKFIFVDIAQSPNFYGFRFLFWIVLFTLFHYGLTRFSGFTGNGSKYGNVLAGVLSLLVAIVIPGAAIQQIVSLYGAIIVLILSLVIPIALLLFLYSVIQGTGLPSIVARILVVILVILAYQWFQTNVETLLGGLP